MVEDFGFDVFAHACTIILNADLNVLVDEKSLNRDLLRLGFDVLEGSGLGAALLK